MLTIFASLLAVASAAPGYRRQAGYGTNGSPTVELKNGTISGVHSSTYNEDYFLGIPYAQPPVNGLRFKNPQSLNTTYNSTFEATEYANSCVGYGGDQIGYPVSEDCLYLNIVRPSGYENETLPIGLWIHGGGLYMGGSRDARYNLSFIVENSVKIGKPIIGVSINYRLSGWGLIASEQVSGSGDTNIGLRDQRLALHWVQENIGAFGGDPSKVTIWGESAGAASVGWHLLAYNGRDDGLFRAGIMQSGNPVAYNSYRSVIDYQPRYDALVNATGCGNAIDSLECLRYAPYEKVNAFFNSTGGSGWNPIVDGDFIQRWGSLQLEDGDFVRVPIISGANTDEGTAFGPRGINSDEDFADTIADSKRNAYLPERYVSEVLEAYPNTPDYYIPPVEEIGNYTYPNQTQYRRSAAYWGDVVMIANRRGACEAWAAHGVDAYSYRFNTIPNGIPFTTGVTHFMEVAFVFDNTQGLGYGELWGTVNPYANKSESYQDLGFLMSSSWASFIHDLDPNGYKGRDEETPAWPVYSLEQPENIVFDTNVTGVAFNEPDTWREEGIRFILDHAIAYKR
jgi:carboxylesterase type B